MKHKTLDELLDDYKFGGMNTALPAKQEIIRRFDEMALYIRRARGEPIPVDATNTYVKVEQ